MLRVGYLCEIRRNREFRVMDSLGSINNGSSAVNASALAQSNSSASPASTTAFSTILNNVANNNAATTASTPSASQSSGPTSDPATWAEMAVIDPTTGKAYFTPVDAQVETALEGAVAAHIPGFYIDAVSQQTYIKPADIRLNPSIAAVSNSTSNNSVTANVATNSTTATTVPPTTATIANVQNSVNAIASQIVNAASVALAQSNSASNNSILNNSLTTTSATQAAPAATETDLSSLTANLGQLISSSIAKNTYNTIDKLLAS